MGFRSMRRLTRSSLIAIFVVLWNSTALIHALSVPSQPQASQVLPSTNNGNILFPILYESSRVLVVRKPHGIGHHDETRIDGNDDEEINDDSSHTHSVVTPGVLTLLRRERNSNNERLYGVHRLDKVTSGILVLAKDAQMAQLLSSGFATGSIQKVYIGLSGKKPRKKKQGWVNGSMERSRNKSWKLVRNGKSGTNKNFAKTQFFTTGLQTIPTNDDNGTTPTTTNPTLGAKTVILFRPFTGKTHQLRVAAKAMGIPLLGDPIYKDGSSNNSSEEQTNTPPSTRTMLHASGIQIPAFDDHPEINVWCPPTFFEDCQSNEIESIDLAERYSAASQSLCASVERLLIKHGQDIPGILQAQQSLLEQD